jgi:hypothetical protein
MGMNSRIRSRSLRNLAAGAAVALAAFTSPASADVIEFSWNLTGNSAPTVHQRTFSSVQNNPSSVLTARAYATSGTNGTGDIVARNLGLYSGGLGVSGATSDPNTSPNHSLDNVGPNDLILFEFAAGGYNPKSVTIGWKQGDADIQIWVGGPNSAGLNLTNACAGNCDVSDLASLGFSVPALEYTDLQVGVPRLLSTTLTGRYLLVAARFEGGSISGGDDDYMKISGLVAKVSRVPEPATAALLLLGLAALGRPRKARQIAGERAS